MRRPRPTCPRPTWSHRLAVGLSCVVLGLVAMGASAADPTRALATPAFEECSAELDDVFDFDHEEAQAGDSARFDRCRDVHRCFDECPARGGLHGLPSDARSPPDLRR